MFRSLRSMQGNHKLLRERLGLKNLKVATVHVLAAITCIQTLTLLEITVVMQINSGYICSADLSR